MKDKDPKTPIRDRATAKPVLAVASTSEEPKDAVKADTKTKEKEFAPRYEENAAGEVIAATVKLRYPKNVMQWLPDVGNLTEVRITEITMADRRAANRAKKPGDSELDDEMMLMAIVTKLPLEVVEQLNSRDYNTIQIAMGKLFF